MWSKFIKKKTQALTTEEKTSVVEAEKEKINSVDEVFSAVEQLTDKDKKILLRQLAKELDISLVEDDDYWKTDAVFTEEAEIQYDFPKRSVVNRTTLNNHVEKEYKEAPKVTYETKEVSVRVSKDSALTRKYVCGMYTNEDNVVICQMCQKESEQIAATEIANYGIELPQLNLCLCRNCSSIYAKTRDTKKGPFKSRARAVIKKIDTSQELEKYEANIIEEHPLYFTQTHLVELQKIFELMSKK